MSLNFFSAVSGGLGRGSGCQMQQQEAQHTESTADFQEARRDRAAVAKGCHAQHHGTAGVQGKTPGLAGAEGERRETVKGQI